MARRCPSWIGGAGAAPAPRRGRERTALGEAVSRAPPRPSACRPAGACWEPGTRRDPRQRRGSAGGAEGIRTPDLLNAIQTRSQLRHSPTKVAPVRTGDRQSTRAERGGVKRAAPRALAVTRGAGPRGLRAGQSTKAMPPRYVRPAAPSVNVIVLVAVTVPSSPPRSSAAIMISLLADSDSSPSQRLPRESNASPPAFTPVGSVTVLP